MKYIKCFELFKDKYFDTKTQEYDNLPDDWIWGSNGYYKLNLNDYNSALKYLYLHGDPHLFKNKQLDMNQKCILNLTIKERIEVYMEEFKKISSFKEVEIYRALNLSSINDLNLNNIGEYWSFKKEGTGTYGAGSKLNTFLLTGKISPLSINWEIGFLNFMTYSEQFECNVLNGSKVNIVKINNDIVNIEGII